MAFDTVGSPRDKDGVKLPSYYNPTNDANEVLQGSDGASIIKFAKGAVSTAINAGTAAATAQVSAVGYNAVIVIHTMTGVTSGGWVKVCNKTASGGTQLPTLWTGETNFGLNIKTSNQAANYSMIVRGITDYIDIVLARADGTHTVLVIPLIL